jgi:protein tyrosine phosphatase
MAKILTSSGDFFNLPHLKFDPSLCLEGQKPSNVHKNRYTNVLPLDETRVKINNIDYINANYIDLSCDQNKKIIACQGPTRNTELDFWTMVIENKTPCILMLTNTLENGKVKCSNYYPLKKGQKKKYQDGLLIENTGVENKEGYTISSLEIESRGIKAPHKLKHIHYSGWSDHGVPDATKLLNILVDFSEICIEKTKGIPICHCSAGLGRTGTVISILRCLETKESPKDVVCKLRSQRHGMVQTKEQYRFILDFIKED